MKVGLCHYVKVGVESCSAVMSFITIITITQSHRMEVVSNQVKIMTTDFDSTQQLNDSLVNYRLSLQSYIFRLIIKWMMGRIDYSKPIDELRADYEGFSRYMTMSKRVEVEDTLVEGLHAEWITPAELSNGRTILYVHGGGWALCSCNTHRALAARIAIASKARTLLFDYRLIPEHPFPAGLDDSLMMYRGLLQSGLDPEKIIIMGDSAGGNLVLAALIALRDAGEPLPVAAVCLSPVTDLTNSGETVKSHAQRDPFFKPGDFVLSELYIADNDPKSALISPLFADLKGFPPLLIQVGYDEVLLSDSTRLAEKAKEAGVNVKLEVWKGMWHVWHNQAPGLPEARRAIQHIGDFVEEIQQEK